MQLEMPERTQKTQQSLVWGGLLYSMGKNQEARNVRQKQNGCAGLQNRGACGRERTMGCKWKEKKTSADLFSEL